MLFGVFDGSALHIRAWRAGNPAPKRGRMLVDVHGDAERIESVLRDAGEQEPLKAFRPVGCFFARNSPSPEFPERCREVYSLLFPERRQVALILRLDGRKSEARFYARSTNPLPPAPMPLLIPDVAEIPAPPRRV